MNLVDQLHQSHWQGVFHLAGGAEFLRDLLIEPGASNTVLEAVLPYSNQSMIGLLGEEPDSYCSEPTARRLAMGAYLRALNLGANSGDVFGLGLTASLKSSEPKKGDHRAYIALQTQRSTTSWHLPLVKDELSRVEEESTLAKFALESMLSSLQIDTDIAAGEPFAHVDASSDLENLFTSSAATTNTRTQAVMPGAFNPLHDAHRTMKTYAQQRLGVPVHYELCVHNVDKPSLDFVEIQNRLSQFGAGQVVVTNQPTFVEKAELLFPHGDGYFVVGADTIIRIDQARYYTGKYTRRQAIDRFQDLNIRFLVFGRQVESRFTSLSDLSLNPDLESLCEEVAESDFRLDISSTEIRSPGST